MLWNYLDISVGALQPAVASTFRVQSTLSVMRSDYGQSMMQGSRYSTNHVFLMVSIRP